MKLFKNFYMELALKKAEECLENNEIPVGAVVVNANNEILSVCCNKTLKYQDATAHAEILAIREACKKINNMYLENCVLYSTLEPCVMCSGAVLHTRISSIYFGAFNKKYGAVNSNAKVFSHGYPHRPKIYGGIYEKESMELLSKFFKTKR